MRIGSLFTGYGGLTMATEQFLGGRTVWTCDNDPGAARVIAHRFPDAPNLGDITRIDWAAVEPIDALDAGWPCQPFSHAGKRKGTEDDRALWPQVARAVRALRPRHVVLENVAAIATAGELARACADLAALGYVGQWRCLRAADVGAPHGRARIFILATDANYGAADRQWSRPQPRRRGAAPDPERGRRDGRSGELGTRRRAEPAHGGVAVADASRQGPQGPVAAEPNGWPVTAGRPATDPTGDGWHEGRPEPARLIGGPDAAQRSAGLVTHAASDQGRLSDRDDDATDTDCSGIETLSRRQGRGDARRPQPVVCGCAAWGQYGPAIHRWERALGRPAPNPTELSAKGARRLSPLAVEWMMGLPDGHVTAVPGIGRSAQLKALGNGVVPQQALAALQLMAGAF